MIATCQFDMRATAGLQNGECRSDVKHDMEMVLHGYDR
jgi:hypothetical protein